MRGIKNILISQGMLPGRIVRPKEQYVIPATGRYAYKAPIEGIVTYATDLGAFVHKGDVIAQIHDPIREKTRTITSRDCGFMFEKKLLSKAEKGDTLGSILQVQKCTKHKTKPKRIEKV